MGSFHPRAWSIKPAVWLSRFEVAYWFDDKIPWVRSPNKKPPILQRNTWYNINSWKGGFNNTVRRKRKNCWEVRGVVSCGSMRSTSTRKWTLRGVSFVHGLRWGLCIVSSDQNALNLTFKSLRQLQLDSKLAWCIQSFLYLWQALSVQVDRAEEVELPCWMM